MAGEGWRAFTREVLDPEVVQGYLMDQAVMVFASASQRTSELAAPAEGMVSYLQDSDWWYGYNDGTGWSPLFGKPGSAGVLSSTGVAATGYGSPGGTLRQMGNGMAAVALSIQRTGAAITPNANGKITNANLLTLPAGWTTLEDAPLVSGSGAGRTYFGYIPAGQRTVQITGTIGSADIATGASITLCGTYPLATPDQAK